MSGSGHPEWLDKSAQTYLGKTTPAVADYAVKATEYRDSWEPTERWPEVGNKSAYATKVAQNVDPGLPRGRTPSSKSSSSKGSSSRK